MPTSIEPLVSIVVPNYNYGRFLPDLLRSIEAQTYRNWECIVVDDGSTDNSVEVVAEAAAREQRIHLLRKNRAGAVSCTVAAVPMVRGEIVAFVDSDDEMLPDRLASVVDAFQAEPDAGLLVHRLYLVDEQRHVLGMMPLAQRLPSGDLREQTLRGRMGIAGLGVTSGLAVRADLLRWLHDESLMPTSEAANVFDEFIRRCVPLLAPVISIDRPLGLRRLHGRNISRGLEESLLAVVERHLRIYAEQERVQGAVIERLRLERSSSADDLDLLSMRFVQARVTGADGSAGRAYFGAPGFAGMPRSRRWFWRVSRVAPRPVFERMVSGLYSPGGRKPLLNHLRLRMRRVVVPDSVGAGVATTWSVVRQALRGGW